MLKPAKPKDEDTRLAVLRSLHILDTPPEERFDRITRLAQRLLNVPICLLSLVDEDRQWFKSKQGLDACETGRDVSFCGHAILGDDTFYVPNALEDPRFADNPLVLGGPKVRFYAGHPLSLANGSKGGTLCVIDNEPRQLSAQDLAALHDLADLVESELNALQTAELVVEMKELQEDLLRDKDQLRKSNELFKRCFLTDPLTELPNRRHLDFQATRELARSFDRGQPLSVLHVDLDCFGDYNQERGSRQGNEALQGVAKRLRELAARPRFLARLDGLDDFILLAPGCGSGAAARLAEEVRLAVRDMGIRHPTSPVAPVLTVTVGTTTMNMQATTVSNLLERAEGALKAGRQAGRDTTRQLL